MTELLNLTVSLQIISWGTIDCDTIVMIRDRKSVV